MVISILPQIGTCQTSIHKQLLKKTNMKTVSKLGERLSLIYRNNMQQICKISLILKVMHGRTNRIVTKLPACSDVSFIKVLFSRLLIDVTFSIRVEEKAWERGYQKGSSVSFFFGFVFVVFFFHSLLKKRKEKTSIS